MTVMLISIITNKTNTTNPVMSQVSPTSLAPLEVSNRSSFHSSLPNFPPHLPDFPLCLGEKTENSCCVLFGGGEGLFQKMYVLYYIYIYIICHPFFFEIWNASKKNVRISFFCAMLLSSLISFPTDPSQLVRCFLVIPWHETMEMFKVSPVKMKTSVVFFLSE